MFARLFVWPAERRTPLLLSHPLRPHPFLISSPLHPHYDTHASEQRLPSLSFIFLLSSIAPLAPSGLDNCARHRRGYHRGNDHSDRRGGQKPRFKNKKKDSASPSYRERRAATWRRISVSPVSLWSRSEEDGWIDGAQWEEKRLLFKQRKQQTASGII